MHAVSLKGGSLHQAQSRAPPPPPPRWIQRVSVFQAVCIAFISPHGIELCYSACFVFVFCVFYMAQSLLYPPLWCPNVKR